MTEAASDEATCMKLTTLPHRYTASGALVADLPGDFPAEDLVNRLRPLPGLLYLDSSSAADGRQAAPGARGADEVARRLDRYSFAAADPVFSFALPAEAVTPEQVLRLLEEAGQLLEDCRCPTIPALPPFQGGLAGLLSFDAGLATLGVSPADSRRSGTPGLHFGVYDVVFAFDHLQNRAWAVSQGIPARGPTARRRRAAERLEHLLAVLAKSSGTGAGPARVLAAGPSATAVPRVPLAGHGGVFTSHSPADYEAMVQAGIDYVRAGDIFQVNLAQQFSVPAACDPLALYRRARRLNPAPFAGFYAAGDTTIASMSPERFLRVKGDRAWMHPIKGTRRMLASPEADLWAGADLGASAKDRAENVMIVDLVRNDLARVCRPESVRVEALCRLERFRYVQHLVSLVSGRLRPGAGPLAAVLAAFPGGSVTGAPKQRACEIIGELERAARGPYCGSLGYVGFDGTSDFNLLIRSFVVRPDEILFSAGGGITVGSDPAAEYAESLHKAEGMLRVIGALREEAVA